MADEESRIITLASAEERGLEYEEPAERRCEWCGNLLDPIGLLGFNGKVIWIGAKECECDGACEERALAEEAERKRRAKAEAEALRRCGVKPRFAHAKVDRREIAEYLDAFDMRSGVGLYITGPSRAGKSHCATALAKAFFASGYSVLMTSSLSMLDEIKASYDAPSKQGVERYAGYDVLIIDDIQNIIGKRASVDYFFQLMDEFIRNNKKVVIAADRAPKDLSMDERLTSRFNAGMLCLVAEPSYEMKYKILQRYYENTIVAAPEAGDDSLLAAYGGDGGHLTDEHFKHMAEVSGTNIRELESFCERCAGEAGDREREGGGLTFDDIDAIASQYFDTSAKKINVQTVQSVIEEQYGVTHEELIGPRRNANIAKARHIAIYLAIEMCEMTTTAVGAEFGNRNHSTVSTSYKKVQKMIQEDRTVTEDLKSLRDKITLRS